MGHNFLLFQIKDLIGNPAHAWETIDTEKRPVSQIRNGILFPLSLLVSISGAMGSLFYINPGLSPVYSVFTGIEIFIALYISTYASAYILREISHALGLERNYAVSFRLIVYSIVPFLLCQIVNRLFESLLFVDVLALFGLYIFWTGAGRMLKPPANKKIPLLIGTLISYIVVFVLTDYLFTKLIDKIYYAFFS